MVYIFYELNQTENWDTFGSKCMQCLISFRAIMAIFVKLNFIVEMCVKELFPEKI